MLVVRTILFYRNYFPEFYSELPHKIQKKIDYVFAIIRTVKIVPAKFLRHIEGTMGLYEIRVEYSGDIFRIFCCFDTGNKVVLFNAFQKKSRKTPGLEIETTLKLMNEYLRSDRL
jgi:phage-related protein